MTKDDYQQTAQALACETKMHPASADRIEKQLLSALASRTALSPANRLWLPPKSVRRLAPSVFARSGSADRRSLGGGWSGGRFTTFWAAAAAILLIAASVTVWQLHKPTSVIPTAHTPSSLAALPAVTPIEPEAPPAEVVAATGPVRQTASRKPAPKPHVITPTGFVDLPWTAGLPAFESGEIVRMDVPVATLPTYGIDISAGTGGGPVEADVLIGQDGFARAIRLVTSTARSTQ